MTSNYRNKQLLHSRNEENTHLRLTCCLHFPRVLIIMPVVFYHSGIHCLGFFVCVIIICICIYSMQPTRSSQISNCQGWQLNAGVTILCSVYIYSHVQSHLSIQRSRIIALILSNSLVWSKPVRTGPAGNNVGIKQQFNTVI